MMKRTKTIGLMSMIGYIIFTIILAMMHILRPDKNMLAAFVSEYAVGNYGWLMSAGFFLLASSSSYLFIGLLLSLNASNTSNISFGLFCVGSFLFSIFPTDVPVIPPTVHGLVHAFSALIALLSLAIAMIAWGFVFNKNKSWNSMAKTSWIFGVISLGLFISLFASPPAYKGLAERILMLWDIVWLMIISRKLYHAPRVLPVW